MKRRMGFFWGAGCIHDQTDDGGRLKWLPIVDEYSRELLIIEVARSITAEDVVRDLERLVRERGAPEFIRSDNSPEFVARAVRDWIGTKGFKTCFIESGSPWRNTYIESFNSRFRDEFLNLEVFGSLLEAKMSGEEHRYKYNHQRPHSSLGDLTPAEFASRCPSPLRPPACAPKDSATNINPNSHRSWFKEQGHAKRCLLEIRSTAPALPHPQIGPHLICPLATRIRVCPSHFRSPEGRGSGGRILIRHQA